MFFILQREETRQALITRDAEIASLTQRLAERPDESFWRGRLEEGDRRYQEVMARLERKTGELGASQLKYE